MSVTFERHGDFVEIVAAGDYAPRALIEVLEAALGAETGSPPARFLLDVRSSRSLLRRSLSDLRVITDFYLRRVVAPHRRVALLVAGPAQHGIMRIATTWVSLAGARAKVFRDRAAALAWLDANDV